MLKKVLCMVIITMTLMASLAVTTNVGAQETGKHICIVGDVDLDGKITIKDASTIQKAIAGIISLTEKQLSVSDVTNDKKLNVKDVSAIQRYIAGIEDNGIIGTELEIDEPEETPEENNKVIEVSDIEKAVADKFLEYVNKERMEVGLNPLKINTILTKAAELRGDEITEMFSHTRPNGKDCFTAIKGASDFYHMGENIAYNAGIIHFEFLDTEKEIAEEIDYAARFFFGQFKSSKGHYANMINENFNCTGIGVNLVEHEGWTECYIAHMFGETR